MPPKRKIPHQTWDRKGEEMHNNNFSLEHNSGSDFEVVFTGKKPRNESFRTKPKRLFKQENFSERCDEHTPKDTETKSATDFDSGLGQLLSLNNMLYNNVLKEILDRLKSIQDAQKSMEEWQKDRDEEICSRLDRIDKDLEALQNGTLAIREASADSGLWPTKVIPLNPFTLGSELEALEKRLQDDETLRIMVKEFENLNANDYEKYIRMCWRKIFVDELAEKYCWRGTTTKKCIRPLSITLAIRSAGRKKYPSFDESVFDRASQKFFQYAHDRLMKLANYTTKSKKFNQDDPLAISASDVLNDA